MKPTVYICRDCPSCERVVAYIEKNKVKCEVVNISDGGKNAPFIGVFPALYEENILKAYGSDIMDRI